MAETRPERPSRLRFDRFVLDSTERQLLHDGVPVPLNARYLDALVLLAGAAGRLVTKQQLLADVWRGVPVTDEALTQCVRTLRRQLGDSATAPRFIETVPKHGYRFVAPVTAEEPVPVRRPVPAAGWARVAVAGTAGGTLAGLAGGAVYGLIDAGGGAIGGGSALIVLAALTGAVGLLGGGGVSLGVALAAARTGGATPWLTAGGATGGLLVGLVAELVGGDAFRLLLGRAPADMTGASEGLLLGAAAGAAAWLALRRTPNRAGTAALIGAAVGAIAGTAATLAGGRLMGGSLALLETRFPGSGLQLARLGGWFGEPGFGPLAGALTAAGEGALFTAALVGAMAWMRRRG